MKPEIKIKFSNPFNEFSEALKNAIDNPKAIEEAFQKLEQEENDRRSREDPLNLMRFFQSPRNILMGIGGRTAGLLHSIAYWIEDRLY